MREVWGALLWWGKRQTRIALRSIRATGCRSHLSKCCFDSRFVVNDSAPFRRQRSQPHRVQQLTRARYADLNASMSQRHLTLLQLNDLHGYLEPHPEVFRGQGKFNYQAWWRCELRRSGCQRHHKVQSQRQQRHKQRQKNHQTHAQHVRQNDLAAVADFHES